MIVDHWFPEQTPGGLAGSSMMAVDGQWTASQIVPRYFTFRHRHATDVFFLPAPSVLSHFEAISRCDNAVFHAARWSPETAGSESAFEVRRFRL